MAEVGAAASVFLNIYDLVVDDSVLTNLNNKTVKFGFGAFHTGIEIFNREISFGVLTGSPFCPLLLSALLPLRKLFAHLFLKITIFYRFIYLCVLILPLGAGFPEREIAKSKANRRFLCNFLVNVAPWFPSFRPLLSIFLY